MPNAPNETLIFNLRNYSAILIFDGTRVLRCFNKARYSILMTPGTNWTRTPRRLRIRFAISISGIMNREKEKKKRYGIVTMFTSFLNLFEEKFKKFLFSL